MSKVALVTGASRGIGRAIATRLATDGYTVAVHYGQSRAAADEVVSQIVNTGGKAFAVQADVASLDSIKAMFAQLDAQLMQHTGASKIDVLVNNAGIAIVKSVEDYTEEDFDRQFDTNIKSVFFITQLALSRLNNNGRIINLGTGLTRFSIPDYAAYSASKGAVEVLTQSLAALLGPRGITVNTVAPGAVDTDINAAWLKSEQGRKYTMSTQALKQIAMPSEIADVVAFLASSDSRWITGQRIEASGGAHL